jgi:hypothetical protein
MLLRKARRRSVKQKVVVVTMLVFAVSSAVALASSTDVWIGTSGSDTINQSGNTRNVDAWGLAGSDTLTGGKGFNKIVGDGKCPYNNKKVTEGQDDSYCSLNYADHFPDVDSLTGGSGPNVIYDGGDATYTAAGPALSGAGGTYNTGNIIYGSPSVDVINATQGSSTVYPGTGLEGIDTLGGGKDYIICQPGDGLTAILADKTDVIVNPHNCGIVIQHSGRARTSSASSWTRSRAHRWLVAEAGYVTAMKTASARTKKRQILAHIKADIESIKGIAYIKR